MLRGELTERLVLLTAEIDQTYRAAGPYSGVTLSSRVLPHRYYKALTGNSVSDEVVALGYNPILIW